MLCIYRIYIYMYISYIYIYIYICIYIYIYNMYVCIHLLSQSVPFVIVPNHFLLRISVPKDRTPRRVHGVIVV